MRTARVSGLATRGVAAIGCTDASVDLTREVWTLTKQSSCHPQYFSLFQRQEEHRNQHWQHSAAFQTITNTNFKLLHEPITFPPFQSFVLSLSPPSNRT